MIKVIITRGLPGSGRTTWSKQFILDNDNFIRVNRDDIRSMLSPNYYFGSGLERLVSHLEKESVINAILLGYSVVIDATNFRPFSINLNTHFKKIYNIDVEVEIKSFEDVSLEECLLRDSKRDKPVGEEVIMRMYNKYLKKEDETT